MDARGVAPGGDRSRRRQPRGDRRRREADRTRDGCPSSRSCSSASSTSPTRRARAATSTRLRLRACARRLHRRRNRRRSKRRSSASRPASASGSSPGTSAASRRWRPTTPTTSAATSSPAPTTRCRLVFRPRVALDPYATGHPRRLPVLGGDAARRRRARHVRLQRGALGAAPARAGGAGAGATNREPAATY